MNIPALVEKTIREDERRRVLEELAEALPWFLSTYLNEVKK